MANLTVAQAKVAMTSASDAQIEAACKARGYTIGSPAQNRSKLQFALDRLKPDSDSKIDEKDFPPIIVINPSTKKRKPAPKPVKSNASTIKVEPEKEDDSLVKKTKTVVDEAKKLDAKARPWLPQIELGIEILALIVMGIGIGSNGGILYWIGLVLIFAQMAVSIRRG